jgi:hypothetical protein
VTQTSSVRAEPVEAPAPDTPFDKLRANGTQGQSL